MKKGRISVAVLICLGILVSCNQVEDSSNRDDGLEVSISEPTKTQYQKISAEQAKNIMDDGKPFILLDVRTDEEYQEERINGAKLIPYDEIKNRAAELPDKDARILVYCRSGRRSEIAARELIAIGYTNIYDFGGIANWPYETVGK